MQALEIDNPQAANRTFLSHKIAMELALGDTADDGLHERISAHVIAIEGVTHAGFSTLLHDVIVIEYDPGLTTPRAVYDAVGRLCAVRRKVHF